MKRRGDGFVRTGVTLLDEGVTVHILLGVSRYGLDGVN